MTDDASHHPLTAESVAVAVAELAERVRRAALSVGEQRSCEAQLSALRLDWKRAWIVVVLSVHKQNRCLDFVSMHKRRNVGINILGIPERPAFRLKAERC